jgi:2-oxoglutarate dehydrogenase E1 component
MARGQVIVESASSADKREAVFDAFRRWGYLQANLDPLGDLQPVPMPELDVDGKDAQDARLFYCGSVGAEFMHIPDGAKRRWVAEHMELDAPAPDRARILDRLVTAEIFEQVLQTRYLGTKRYSLEGNASLIPLLDEILDVASAHGAEQGVIGMSHRGRLNVMVHTVGRDAAEVFARFEDVDPRSVLGSGDVKYHLGATGIFATASGAHVEMHLVSNPSHLEAVDPVLMGRARAKQTRIGQDGKPRVLPILLHHRQ